MLPDQRSDDRYPGGRPFADNDLDQRLFFGRETEVEELANQIVAAGLLVLFGKSGVGKTSLLQAGVFPKLRKQQLLPLVIRLNQPERSLMEDFLTDIAEQCGAQGIDHTPGESGSLWEYFKTTAFWRNGELQTPVLVIDQGEEIFTLHSAEMQRRIGEELGQLLRSGLPEMVRARRERGEEISYSERPPAVKVVLSLREDYLGHLEGLAAELPQILEKRFRLMPLDRSAARRAVIEPAGLPQGVEFRTPAFHYSDAAVDEILDFLTGKDGLIEPFQLQVLCHHVEQKVEEVKASGRVPVVEKGMLGGKAGMEGILQGFYRSALRRVHRRGQRKRARQLCEDGLLDDAGRRLSLEDGQIRSTYKLRRLTLKQLVDERVLRQEPRLDSFYYEISHDSLAAPILKSRRWRMPRRIRRMFAVAHLAVIVVSLFLFFVGRAYLKAEENRKQTEQLLGNLFWPLTDKLQELGNFDLLKTLSDEAIKTYSEMGSEEATEEGLNNRGAAYVSRALVKDNSGDLEGAFSDLDTAANYFKQAAARNPAKSIYLSNASIAYSSLGDVTQRLNSAVDAMSYYKQALSAAKNGVAVGAEGTGIEAKYSLAGAHYRLAKSHRDLGEFAAASAALHEARSHLEDLASTNRSDPRWVYWSISVHMRLGAQLWDRGEHVQAFAEYQEARNIAGRLSEEDAQKNFHRQNLIAVEDRIAEATLALCDYGRSRASSESNRDKQKQLHDDYPADARIELNVALAHSRLGDVLADGVAQLNALRAHAVAVREKIVLDRASLTNLDLAEQEYKSSSGIYADAVAKSPKDTSISLELASLEKSLGDLYSAKGRGEDATTHYLKAQTILSGLIQRDSANKKWQHDFSVLGTDLGNALLIDGRLDEARETLNRALATQQQLVAGHRRSTRHAIWQASLANTHDALGDLCVATQDVPAALDEYDKAREIRTRLIGLSPRHVGWELQYLVTLCKLAHTSKLARPGMPAVEAYLSDAARRMRNLESSQRLSPVAMQAVQLMSSRIGSHESSP